MTGKTKKTKPKIAATIKIPDEAAFAELKRSVKLEPDRLTTLSLVIIEAADSLKQHDALMQQIGKRSDRLKRLKTIDRVLEAVASQFKATPKQLDKILPSQMGETLGGYLTFGALEDLLGEKVFHPRVKDGIRKTIEDSSITSINDIDDMTAERRKTLGMRDAPQLVVALVRALRAPIQQRIELEKMYKGGRPEQIARNWLIHELARNAPAIIGKKATSTANGRFARLCSETLKACGLSAKGVEEAVEHTLQKLKAPKR